MRRSELDPRVAEAALALSGPSKLLLIGKQARVLDTMATCVQHVREVQVDGERYDSAWWWTDGEGDLLAELRTLRAVLTSGARLVTMSEQQPPALERLRALVGAKRRGARERVCSALLLAGFLEPRAQVAFGVLLVRASLPARRDPLDALFEQPPRE